MTKKKRTSGWTWREYLLQLSVVIAGIMVTFIGSDLINRWSRARQVKATMQLVVEELRNNRGQMKRAADRLIKERHGMLMFNSYGFDLDIIPEDSLVHYDSPHIIAASIGFMLQSDALEVLKSSGVIASVEDKHLLMQLLGCYTRLEDFSASLAEYNQMKMNSLNHLFEHMNERDRDHFSIGGDAIRESWRIILANPMCMSFIGFSAFYFGDDDYLRAKVADVEQTIDVINGKYKFK